MNNNITLRIYSKNLNVWVNCFQCLTMINIIYTIKNQPNLNVYNWNLNTKKCYVGLLLLFSQIFNNNTLILLKIEIILSKSFFFFVCFCGHIVDFNIHLYIFLYNTLIHSLAQR